MWLHSLKVAQLLRSAACLHTNQSRSYLNHLVLLATGIIIMACFCGKVCNSSHICYSGSTTYKLHLPLQRRLELLSHTSKVTHLLNSCQYFFTVHVTVTHQLHSPFIASVKVIVVLHEFIIYLTLICFEHFRLQIIMLSGQFHMHRCQCRVRSSPHCCRPNLIISCDSNNYMYAEDNKFKSPEVTASTQHRPVSGVFARLRKASIGFVMSVELSDCQSLYFHGTSRLPPEEIS